METPDPPNDTPGTSKQVVLTPHDIPKILRECGFWLDLQGYCLVVKRSVGELNQGSKVGCGDAIVTIRMISLGCGPRPVRVAN